MRVRCRAIAEPRSNALGTLELESTEEGLWLRYESVSSYRDGYAPGPPAVRSEHRVPWSRVRALRVGTGLLRLEVQEPLSPFTHFVLRDFALVQPEQWLARARAWSRLDAPQVVLTQLCHELSLRLGSPVLREEASSSWSGLERGPSLRSLPRSGVATFIVVCSATLAALMLGKAPELAPHELSPASTATPPPAAPPAASAPAPAALASPAPPSAPRPPNSLEQADLPLLAAPGLGGGCECVRHESLLWQRPPPRLTALLTKLERRPHGTHQHLDLELTMVNNGHRELRGFHLGVEISTTHADPDNRDDAPVERSQYFPGPLAPGQALTWEASAQGDRFRLRVPELGRLDEDGIDAAPVAAFAELAAGPPGLVRLHAATMLAFLGDPGARPALLRAREGLADPELAQLERAVESTASLRVCQLVVSSVGRATRAQSCLYNAADVAQSNFELKARALRWARPSDGNPFPPVQLLAEERLAWTGTLPPRRGRRLDLTFDLSRAGSSPEHRIELLAVSPGAPQ